MEGRVPFPIFCLAAGLALVAPAAAWGSVPWIAGSYRLDVSSAGAQCPPIIHTDLTVGQIRSGSAQMVLDGQPATATLQGDGLAFTAQFADFDSTGPVGASGAFQRYSGRIHVDINLRWPNGDCLASLTGYRPDPAPAQAGPTTVERSEEAANPPRQTAPQPTTRVPTAPPPNSPSASSEAGLARSAEQSSSVLDFLLKLAGASAIGLMVGLGIARLIRHSRG